ncbi:TolC family protein [Myxococcota bacterium]|nr:TolC family protein [Myxococcota bacterium]
MAGCRRTFVAPVALLLSVSGALAPALAAAADGAPLTLERAIALALENNERARIAGARVEIAEARVARARAFFFPDLTLTGTYTHRLKEPQSMFQKQDALSAVAALNLSLFDARGFPLFRRARLERDASRLEAAEERRSVAFDVATAYLTTLSLDEVRQAAEHRLEFARASLADAKARFAAALVSSNDVTRPELELASADRELIRARAAVDTAKVNLAYLIGVSSVGALAAPSGLAAPTSTASAPLRAAASGARLDLEALKKRAEAADATADETLYRMIPRLELYGETRVTNESGLSGNDLDGLVRLNLVWPIFDGGDRYAERDEAKAARAIAETEAAAVERGISREIDEALLGIEASVAALAQAKIAAEIAGRNAKETAELYRQGLASALEVSDANLRLFEAEVNEARETYGLTLAYLALHGAVGLDPLGKEWPK